MDTQYYCPSRDPMTLFLQEMRLRNFGHSTVKSYLRFVDEFLSFCNGKSPKDIVAVDVRNYLDWLVRGRKSASTLNTAYSALKLYFAKILRRSFFLNIPRTKKEKNFSAVVGWDFEKSI